MKVNVCGKCEHVKLVYEPMSYNFLGCHCEPYKGKWIAEIEKCPKLESEVQNES